MADSAVGGMQVAQGAVAEKRAAAVEAARATGRVLAAETVMVVGERVAAATATEGAGENLFVPVVAPARP